MAKDCSKCPEALKGCWDDNNNYCCRDNEELFKKEIKQESTKPELKSAYDFIDEFASDETKALFEYDDIIVSVALKIFDYRINNKMTKKKLAEKLKISTKKLSDYESGDYKFTIYDVWNISKCLGFKLTISLD